MKFFALFVFMVSSLANAGELKILGTSALKPLLNKVQPQFEAATGHKLNTTYVSGPDLVKEQILSGAQVDIGMSSTGAIDEVVKAGKITATSRTCIAQTTIGIGVRQGDVKPDLSSPKKFKEVMLAAQTVAYATEGRSGQHFLAQLQKLGIFEHMEARLRPMTTPTAIAALANGEVQYVALLLSNIMAGKGIELGAPFPKELQTYNRFAAGTLIETKETHAADTLIGFLMGAETAAIMQATGFEACN